MTQSKFQVWYKKILVWKQYEKSVCIQKCVQTQKSPVAQREGIRTSNQKVLGLTPVRSTQIFPSMPMSITK